MSDKLFWDRAGLAARAASLPRPLVFTNGVFDILHRGHVAYLESARALGASLLVAVNTDRSARLLGKGPDRPLNRAEDRAAVLAGLESVSLVIPFDEPTPCEVLKQVRPDLYVKGGDYDIETIGETRLVRSWGGNALAIPFLEGFSTTSLVEKIKGPQTRTGLRAAFIDRDGVINEDRGYVGQPEDFAFLPGAIEGLRHLAAAGFELVIVTNQSGIARGYYGEEDFRRVTAYMLGRLSEAGVRVARVAHCPHLPADQQSAATGYCTCRKPRPGMILDAARALALDLSRSILIGDKPSDIEAGRAAGVGACYLAGPAIDPDGPADGHFADLLACARAITPERC